MELRGNNKKRVRQFLHERDGDNCFVCGSPLGLGTPDIHHIDETLRRKHGYNFHENLRLAHHGCNSSLHNVAKHAILRRSTAPSEHVSVLNYDHTDTSTPPRIEKTDATSLIQEVVDYTQGSTEMQVTGRAELPFRNWLIAYVKRHGKIKKHDATDGGAEKWGVSIPTTSRYLKKMISDEGELTEWKDPELKTRFIIPKPSTLEKWKAEQTDE